MNTGNYGNPANNLDSPTLAGVEFVEWDKVNKKWNVVCSQRCKASYLDKQ